MKKLLIITVILSFIGIASFAQSYSYSQKLQNGLSIQSTTTNPNIRYQDGYYRSNGIYVQTHMKTEKDNTNGNEFGTRGNVNPFILKEGTRPNDYSSESYNYGQGKQIQTGERGGQYYINDNGNKTYVPKRSTSSYPY